MTLRTVYIAHLSSDEYDRFRERDPALPSMYPAWLSAVEARMSALRSRGARGALYPINFDDFIRSMEILHVQTFDEATRDRYAEDMAAADNAMSRL
ncbi:hypothetical protein [Methylobacterium goesingense]|uniref:Uncharacterized protein n=1 Tax=Methylobacterium goesingense TaxID=243690 RepID=A0ABV2LBW4_9HYPH|nr:hypothetical protein [Methylobacterium goesingense]